MCNTRFAVINDVLQSFNESHLCSAICRKRIRSALWQKPSREFTFTTGNVKH